MDGLAEVEELAFLNSSNHYYCTAQIDAGALDELGYQTFS